MNFFKKLFNPKEKTSIYLSGWEARFNGDQSCEDFIATQITTKDVIEKGSYGIELVFEDRKLIRAFNHEDGVVQPRTLLPNEIGLVQPEFPVHSIYQLMKKTKGMHQLGGEIPAGFRLPDPDCVVPFQYFGFINQQDPVFQWLPFTLHLTCPIYLNFRELFLDYSNPLEPVVINTGEIAGADTSYDDLNKDSEIVFKEMKFDFRKDLDFGGSGHAGIPNWIQYPHIPHCPKTGKRMKFVCQLNGGVKTARTNVMPKEKVFKKYFDHLNFWIDGELYVFFEPESKVACYLIQNT